MWRELQDAEPSSPHRSVPILRTSRDLDLFYQDLYQYFSYRGFSGVCASLAMQAVTLTFGIAFSLFLFGGIRWGELLHCTDQAECAPDVAHYLNGAWLRGGAAPLMWAYFLTMLLFWAVRMYGLATQLWRMSDMREYFRHNLQLPDEHLLTMAWGELLDKLALDAQDINNRIMRVDNYLIALENSGLLGVESFGGRIRVSSSRIVERSLRFCVFLPFFTQDNHLNTSLEAYHLSWRFFAVGMVQLIFCPCILMFVLADFTMRHVQEWHVRKNYFGPRVYTARARWLFREYNELPHLLERRLALSYKAAHRYVAYFPSPTITPIAKAGMFITGSFATLLLLLGVLDEAVLLYVHVGERPLLFYLPIFSMLFATFRACVPVSEDPIHDEPEVSMQKIAAHTHYFPITWKTRCHTAEVRATFEALYQHKARIFLHELAGVLLCPWILMTCYMQNSSRILRFLQQHSHATKDMGVVCRFGMFDLEMTGSDDSDHAPPSKMHCSFLTFCSDYPSWNGHQASAARSQLLARSSLRPPLHSRHSEEHEDNLQWLERYVNHATDDDGLSAESPPDWESHTLTGSSPRPPSHPPAPRAD